MRQPQRRSAPACRRIRCSPACRCLFSHFGLPDGDPHRRRRGRRRSRPGRLLLHGAPIQQGWAEGPPSGQGLHFLGCRCQVRPARTGPGNCARPRGQRDPHLGQPAPPSHLYPPESFAESAKELAKGLPVKITVWDEKRLEKEGFGGILGVGKGSTRQPRLVKVEYAPAKATQKIALVGKGITFDTGGISIKPALGMGDMKSDMAGAAVVLNTVLAIASLGLPLKATAWLCIAENMPSGAAARPADVFTIYGGARLLRF